MPWFSIVAEVFDLSTSESSRLKIFRFSERTDMMIPGLVQNWPTPIVIELAYSCAHVFAEDFTISETDTSILRIYIFEPAALPSFSSNVLLHLDGQPFLNIPNSAYIDIQGQPTQGIAFDFLRYYIDIPLENIPMGQHTLAASVMMPDNLSYQQQSIELNVQHNDEPQTNINFSGITWLSADISRFTSTLLSLDNNTTSSFTRQSFVAHGNGSIESATGHFSFTESAPGTIFVDRAVDTEIDVTLNNEGDEITLLKIDQLWWESDERLVLDRQISVELHSIPWIPSDRGSAFYFYITGQETCDHISNFTDQSFSNGTLASELLSADCDADTTIAISFEER